ncbi:TetR/AcrR family transcriptional regulator [Salisediminibacterium halotolerans]|uniref:TetR/AcrR family transcriptional regulator, fatty acid metabolism regulator protein n=1 Tax=Salisediminibacterium halotolerans TaxID=517425 RepID=A0A1H9U1X5_9BACI|nr:MULTISPECIES: TetR/AcrR family transcriptional regulator [Salisediminibacterium]RLJ81129.1 TetR family transcriptional regulator [Actinophytocola xinjiangensis]RPE84062.1 TetR family transcriptional regulator [Salisediminibacterium halotolerans]TWG38556.1 TetR family transcriptional regulator [Salisediminibacterium halotolerans]SES03268.1 TetR/AcrR family transcriptional regulator, fatty acid metabolism regulator protein [Salisediminibacterium haloalkalitolerans]GEL07168.1 transcriptional r
MSKKRGEKYDQIIDAAVKVIAENGYHHSQVSKIAREAGVADGTIYLYFKNKEDILISMFEEKMGRFVEKIQERLNGVENTEEKMRILIEMHFSQLEHDHDMAIVTQLELRQSNIAIRHKVNEVLKGYLTLVDELLQEGIETGFFDPQMDRRIARQMIFGALDEIVTNWVMKDHRYELTPLVPTVNEMLLNGISCKQKTS